jgi:hypothetical protein
MFSIGDDLDYDIFWKFFNYPASSVHDLVVYFDRKILEACLHTLRSQPACRPGLDLLTPHQSQAKSAISPTSECFCSFCYIVPSVKFPSIEPQPTPNPHPHPHPIPNSSPSVPLTRALRSRDDKNPLFLPCIHQGTFNKHKIRKNPHQHTNNPTHTTKPK